MANEHGGARPGAGRKPIKDKKIPVKTFVLESEVKAVGGAESARLIASAAIIQAAASKNNLKKRFVNSNK